MNFFISYDRIRKKLYIQKILFTIFLNYLLTFNLQKTNKILYKII